MKVLLKRTYKLDPKLSDWWMRQMEPLGTLENEVCSRPGMVAIVDGVFIGEEALKDRLEAAKTCLCGQCHDCIIAEAVQSLEAQERLIAA